MSRTLTASDRSRLIRLASTLPKGSDERKAILASLGKKAGLGIFGPTMGRFLDRIEAWADKIAGRPGAAGASIESFTVDVLETAIDNGGIDGLRAYLFHPPKNFFASGLGFDVYWRLDKAVPPTATVFEIQAAFAKLEKEMRGIVRIPGIQSAETPECYNLDGLVGNSTGGGAFFIPVKLDPSYFTDAVLEEMVSYYRG